MDLFLGMIWIGAIVVIGSMLWIFRKKGDSSERNSKYSDAQIELGVYCEPIYEVSLKLTALLLCIMEEGVSDVQQSKFYITFQCGDVSCTLWNGNKYEAWLSSGEIGAYSWEGEQPSLEVMAEFKKFIFKETARSILFRKPNPPKLPQTAKNREKF